MKQLIVTATGADGNPVPLNEPISLELFASLDSPAVNFAARFPCDSIPPEIRRVSVVRGREAIFEGAVDSQSFRLSGRGNVLTLEARSKGALLLDNEAQPRTLWAANLSTAFARTAGAYGFALYNPNPSRTLAVYTVHKGMSEWDAFCGFARRMHNLTPYVEGEQVMVCKPKDSAALTLSNGGDGVPWLWVEHTRSPYEVLSQVHIRDSEGQYSTSVKNSHPAARDLRRRRFLIPGTEFADNPGLDAGQRIRASLYQYEEAAVRCPDIRRVFLGQPVRFLDSSPVSAAMMIHSWRYTADSSGVFTDLELRSKAYY